MNTTLTFQEGNSNKFYTLSLEESKLTIQFGRVGSAGQTQVKTFKSSSDALKQYQTLLAEKKKKGYVEEASTAKPAGTAKPRAVSKSGPVDAERSAKAAASAVKAKATKASEPHQLPNPALEDPAVPGLDLAVFRPGPVPQPERDPTPFPSGDFVVEGYSLSFGDDDEVIVTDAKGKRLKSVPDKLRKNEDYQSLMRGRKDDRARERRARRVLEERMISGTALSAEEIAWLVLDDAFSPLLKGLIVQPVGRAQDAGLLLGWDEKKGLGLLPADYDAKWIGWQPVELAHPMKLGDVTTWQDLLVDLADQQALVQAFREVRTVPVAQRKLTESSLLSGRETSSAGTIERVLIEEGWIARRGNARRKMQLRTAEGVTAVEAWFDYGEYYMPMEPTTTGSFGFVDVKTGKALKFNEVPEVLVSEAIRSLEVCLAQSGAKKDADQENEGEAGEAAETSDESSDDEE
jgi:predicted DNA-binding WGR domain protein